MLLKITEFWKGICVLVRLYLFVFYAAYYWAKLKTNIETYLY
jgi:hypothetical protein